MTTTALQIAANAINATRSTGPKTQAGKARASRNALRHGLRSALPVVPGERAEDWLEHRDGVVRSLAPAGGLEAALAERAALCLWRLRRVTAYEAAVTAVGIEEAPEEVSHAALVEVEEELRKAQRWLVGRPGADRLLKELPRLSAEAPVDGGDVREALATLLDVLDARGHRRLPDLEDGEFLARLGVPGDELADAFEWAGCTADLPRRAVEQTAQAGMVARDKLLAWAIRRREEARAAHQAYVERLGRKVEDLRQRLRTAEDRLRRRRLLPDDKILEKVSRYEAHLSRQLLQALHSLERLQAARAGRPVTPPAVLDVTMDAAGTNPSAETAAAN